VSELPILWHIPVSHYSEKVRWALDYKSVEHSRRTPPPGIHMVLALARTRGRQYTFPLMRIDGRTVGDSTAIIEVLESRFPDAPLYPDDPGDRRRALGLEDWFDEQLGPQMRLLAWHEVTREPAQLEQLAVQNVPAGLARLRGVAAATVKSFVNLRYRVRDEDSAENARDAVIAAFDKLEHELGGSEYLVGDRFSVADLTVASLFYPLILPPEGPQVIKTAPAAIERFREPLRERRGYRWVEEMFRRHRTRGGSKA
jgi:glutathione S-transferase